MLPQAKTNPPSRVCQYQYTGYKAVTRAGCGEEHFFVPQEEHRYCPFCGKPIQRAELPDQPMLA